MSLENFGLTKKIMLNIKEVGYTAWTPVQEQVIPIILKGNDVLGCAQTGTGKTAAFSLPIINNIYISNIKNSVLPKDYRKTQALILAPTRDLAIQIFDNIKNYARKMNIKTTCVYGGVSKKRQISILEEGCEIVVGTPGRAMDLINMGVLNIKDVKYRVLDEVDHMLDIGFLEDITKIIELIENPELTLMFSATISKKIKELALQFLKDDHKYIEISRQNSVPETIMQMAIVTNENNFINFILKHIEQNNCNSAIIFTKTKLEVDELEKKMNSLGENASGIHGDKEQWLRNKTIQSFKRNEIKILIATDVIARGIDIPNVDYVYNYHLPEDIENYVHRIGRTGRASRLGNAISLITNDELENLSRIKFMTKQEMVVYRANEIKDILEENIIKLESVSSQKNYKKRYQKPKKREWQKKFKLF